MHEAAALAPPGPNARPLELAPSDSHVDSPFATAANARISVNAETAADNQAPKATPNQSPAPGTESGATVRGRFVGLQGDPIAGLDVRVHTMSQKGPALVDQRTITNPSGEFLVTLRGEQLARAKGFVASVFVAGVPLWRSRGFELLPDTHVDLETIAIASLEPGTLGEFELFVRVVDESGLPVRTAQVSLWAVLPSQTNAVPSDPLDSLDRRQREAAGYTDEQGLVLLKGETLGTKLLEVDSRLHGHRLAFEQLAGVLAGTNDTTITLHPGKTIAGRVRAVDGGVAPHVVLNAWRIGSRRTYNADIDSEGRFTLRGLADGDYSLDFDGRDWSRAVVEPVAAGTDSVDVPMKRRQDERDVGLHAGEIHGRLVDAGTGQGIPLATYDVDWNLLPAEASGGFDLLSDVLPNEVWPRPRQMAAQELPPPLQPEFHLTGLDPGTYVVTISRPGDKSAYSPPIVLQRNQMVTQVAIYESPARTVTGRVLDPEGHPVEGATVVFTGVGPYSDQRIASIDLEVVEGGAARAPLVVGSTRTGPDGTFRTPPLPETLAWRIAALHFRWQPVIHATSGATLDLQFVTGR